MVRFAPFAGIRYDSSRVDLSMVIAPPYDVVSPDERARLAARHSANSVRVELPEPDQRTGLDRYANAARQLEQWQQEEVLRRDPAPVFYAYRMTSPDRHATNGVIGALGIDDASASDILPHEQTLPKAKSDRLDLLKATRANLSPIWGLSMTDGLSATFIREGPPDAAALDDDSILHQLWVIDDPADIRAVQRAAESSPIVVADGHHRYETARTYLRQCQTAPTAGSAAGSAAGSVTGSTAESTAESVMALLVELSEDQLAVGPIHRGLSGLPEGIDLIDAFASWFEVTRAGDFDERTVSALGESRSLALTMPSGAWLLSPKDGTPEAAGADLDSSMVALVVAELPEHDLEFFNSWQDGMGAVASGGAQAVVLLRPVSVGQIQRWAQDRRQMPPKSTYFFPKPRTGMVFRDLDAPG